ncbi:terminase small subunit [Duganella sp. FT135W]|uniref:Terminase small subunit n=1 Tax=Duganella flavida TaxID=2692175 RepID=A0A6L8KFH2_9BURK|nr:terminase small subunit [Duganella flavida]MYM25770.1 terminase small subunit [Duganella flavida]
MELTGKHRLFADAVLAGMSNKDAAIAAGYSAKTAGPAGSRLAKRPDIVDFIAKYKKPGAVPPPPAPAKPVPTFDVNTAIMFSDPKQFLLAAMNDPAASGPLRVDAAKALMPFMHQKVGDVGKKEQKQDAAKKVAGRFSAAAPPKLVAAGGKKV